MAGALGSLSCFARECNPSGGPSPIRASTKNGRRAGRCIAPWALPLTLGRSAARLMLARHGSDTAAIGKAPQEGWLTAAAQSRSHPARRKGV